MSDIVTATYRLRFTGSGAAGQLEAWPSAHPYIAHSQIIEVRVRDWYPS